MGRRWTWDGPQNVQDRQRKQYRYPRVTQWEAVQWGQTWSHPLGCLCGNMLDVATPQSLEALTTRLQSMVFPPPASTRGLLLRGTQAASRGLGNVVFGLPGYCGPICGLCHQWLTGESTCPHTEPVEATRGPQALIWHQSQEGTIRK